MLGKYDKEAAILNRVVQWTDTGITYETHPRHAVLVVIGLVLEDSKAVSTPGTTEAAQAGDDVELDAEVEP